jgi:hypothetical protein
VASLITLLTDHALKRAAYGLLATAQRRIQIYIIWSTNHEAQRMKGNGAYRESYIMHKVKTALLSTQTVTDMSKRGCL